MTVKLVPFFPIGDDLPPQQEKGGIVGTMSPSSVPLASRPSPRALKGLGPKACWPSNAQSILRSSTTKGLGPKASRPKNARPTLRLGASYPGRLFTQVLTFPIGNSIKRSCQLALHVTSVGSPMNQPPRL